MKRSELADFLARFKFAKNKNGYVGIEREHFLVSPTGAFVPHSINVLRLMNDARWTHELSACQVESRTRPQKDLSAIKLELLENEHNNYKIKKLGLNLINRAVGPKTMPLDVYPDQRYLEIAASLTKERLEAAVRVAGTHLHIGVKNMEHALSIYNSLIPRLNKLCRLGDNSEGERLKLYKTVAIKWQPVFYENVEHFFEAASKEGFAENPRNCWQLVRISIHGTVELRMFDAVNRIDEILWWISQVKYLIKEV